MFGGETISMLNLLARIEERCFSDIKVIYILSPVHAPLLEDPKVNEEGGRNGP